MNYRINWYTIPGLVARLIYFLRFGTRTRAKVGHVMPQPKLWGHGTKWYPNPAIWPTGSRSYKPIGPCIK